MAAARLRRTFQYPTESDDEDAVEEGMDEQDQEDLITNLSSKDTSSTRIYTLFILILPLVPVILYLPRLFSLSTIIPSMIAITSLMSTAYTLYFLPLPPDKVSVFTPIDGKREDGVKAKGKSINRSSYGYKVPPITSQSPQLEGRSPVPYIPGEIAELLEKYIVPTNGVFCILLAVHELFQGRTWSEGMQIGGGYVPGLILTTILWARRELRAVDMGELEKLRYRTKH